MKIDIYRNEEIVASFKTDDKTVYSHKVMGEHKITANFLCTSVLPIKIGDYIIWNTEKYYINAVPACERDGGNLFEYTITFESELYKLYNKQFMDEGAVTFDYFGTAEDFVNLILTNINSIDSGWSIGTVETTDPVLMSFNALSCRDALTQIAKQFTLEFFLSGKEINLVPLIGNDTTLQFQYGKDEGLYKLSRQVIEDKNIVTRVYGFGGTKNIDFNYRDGAKQLIFSERYLEANTDLYGIREGSVTFDNIFPHRDGVVSGIDVNNIFSITDDSLDFDINDQLLEGVAAAIIFKDGALGGYQFDIVSYDNDSKTIKFKSFTDSNDYILPNDLNKPSVGDTYTIVNIKMPQSYIDSAETSLKTKTQEYLNQNSIPQVAYNLTIDRFYAQKNNISIKAGDKITIIDSALGINTKIRVAAVDYPLIDPFQISATIAEAIPYTIEEQLISKTVDNTKIIRVVDRTRAEASRINALRARQLQDLIFDPDGYFDPAHIKPESIETLMLSVGAKSQNFNLSGVIIIPNWVDENSIAITSGELIHHEIEIEGLGYIWEMSQSIVSQLDPQKSYYIYAKCSKSALTGTWEISDTPKKVDSETGYWIFNLGILYKPISDKRDFAFTNGMTYINGDQIYAGRVQDISGQNYFDLKNAEFNLGDSNSGLDWNVSSQDKLTIRGGIVQNEAGDISPLGVDRGSYSADATYYPGDKAYSGGSTYKWISPTAGNVAPPNATYWGVEAAQGPKGDKGDQGDQGAQGPSGANGTDGNWVEVRFAKNGSLTSPPSLTNTQTNPTGWDATPPATGTLEYLWMIKATKTADGGLVGVWSNPVRIKGEQGATGAKGDKGDQGTQGPKGNTGDQGPIGPALSYAGIYASGNSYHGGTDRVEVVQYSGNYYITRVDAGNFSGVLPTNTTKWNAVGAQFESIATGLILAQMAYIENLVVGRLSTSADTAKPRIVAQAGELDVFDTDVPVNQEATNKAMIRMGKGAGIMTNAPDSKPGIGLRDTADDDSYTEVSSEGIFTNGSGIDFLSATLGITSNAGFASLLQKRNSDADGISAAIAGIDQTNSGNSKSYGGYFNSLFTGELHFALKSINAGTYDLGTGDCFISYYYSSSGGTINLPGYTNIKPGRTFIIKPINNSVKVATGVLTPWAYIINENGGQVLNVSIARGDMWLFTYDGSYWLAGPLIH